MSKSPPYARPPPPPPPLGLDTDRCISKMQLFTDSQGDEFGLRRRRTSVKLAIVFGTKCTSPNFDTHRVWEITTCFPSTCHQGKIQKRLFLESTTFQPKRLNPIKYGLTYMLPFLRAQRTKGVRNTIIK